MNNSIRKKVTFFTAILVIFSQTPTFASNTSSIADTPTPIMALATSTSSPATFQIAKNKWDGECDYSITMNLWWGANGDTWRVYENGKLVSELNLTNSSPNPQSASINFTNKRNGTYIYTAELVNSAGVTQSQNSVTHVVTKNQTPIDISLPDYASGSPVTGYDVLYEDENNFEWVVYAANPNKNYVWDGSSFSLWSIEFETDSEIKSISNAKSFSQNGNKVTIELKAEERLLPLNTTRTFIVQGTKKSNNKPTNFKSNTIRGNIYYPKYATLPSSWSKNKTNLTINDLISNSSDYYSTTVKTNTGNKLMCTNPASQTQLIIPLPKKMPQPINGVKDLRIWMPSKYLAMGLGTTQEFFGLNPSFMIGLSIKENFTCGLAPMSSGYNENIITYDGEQWSWPIQKLHPDGPFQQEAGNFNEIKKQYSDYLPSSAAHGTYVGLKTGEPDDPSYTHSAISSAISLTMTREFLYSVPKNNFDDFIKNSKDPWAEYVLVDNAYNRGVYGLLQRNLFTTNREAALKSTDINKDFDLSGFANHIENIQNVIIAMDNEKDNIYDANITWSEMESYLSQLRLYFSEDAVSKTEWDAMTADLKNAYNLLAAHWGGDHVSLRYDFLTLLRVIEKHLPENLQPSPTGQSWIDQNNSANQ